LILDCRIRQLRIRPRRGYVQALGDQRKRPPLEWDIRINNHGARIGAMSGESLQGRNLKDGYIRGCGLQFGNVVQPCTADPLFAHAYGLTKPRTARGLRIASVRGDAKVRSNKALG
jgi:hypothetical protein